MEQGFDILRSTKSQQNKLNGLKTALQIKLINAPDERNKNNTLLHIAVQNGEEQIIQFLLDQNANTAIKNDDYQTCLDLAELSGLPNKYSIIQRLRGKVYYKRGETGGIEGQLYESKLLTLIYLRGILNGQETKFTLRTSLEGIAALDDIVLRYKSAGMSKDKLLFLQQKHREDQNKGIVMVDSLLKSSGDFSLVKYFESYLKIKDAYPSEDMVDYEFVLYTPAIDNIKEEYKDSVEADTLIVTNKEEGKIFKFKYEEEHLNKILHSVALSRSIKVAERLVTMKDKYTTMMSDDCIKTYHVFIAKHIFELSKPSDQPYMIGEFQASFLTSENIILVAIRNEIFKRLKVDSDTQASVTKTSYLQNDNQIKTNKSALPTFKLPKKFGIAGSSSLDNGEKDSKFYFIDEKNDRKLLEDFLGKLTFYTHQAQEHEIRDVFNKELDEFPKNKRQVYDSNFQEKHKFAFPIVHEKLQNWWKEDGTVYDIDETCPFYHEALKVIMGSTLLDCLHCTVKENLSNTLIKFKSTSINQQVMEEFFKSSEKLLIISSDEIFFSFVKLDQYIVNNNIERFRYIDIDLICTPTFLCALKEDIVRADVNVLVLVTHKSDSKTIAQKIKQIMQIFEGKIIIVTKACTLNDLKSIFSEASFIDRDQISFKDLDIDDGILLERFAIFQGNEIPVNRLLDSESLNFLPTKKLRDLIDNKIKLNITATAETSNATKDDWYSRRRLYRCISLDTKEQSSHFFTCKDYNETSKMSESKNILLLSNSHDNFVSTCNDNQASNIHWFECVDSLNVWQKSRGSIDELRSYVDRDKGGQAFEKHCNSICDITDRTVVICADAGMGKSTLLNYLSDNIPKGHEVDYWILKLDLSNRILIEQISRWKDSNTDIILHEAFKVLYISLDILIPDEKRNSFYDKKIDLDLDIFNKIMKSVHIDDAKCIHLDKKVLEESGKIEVFKLNLFNTFYNNKKLVLLFDCIDEIVSDFEEELLQLFNTLVQSNVARLWIATRPINTLNQLESILGTFCYSLQPLTVDEQMSYLCKKWEPHINIYFRDQYLLRDNFFEKAVPYLLNFFFIYIYDIFGSSEHQFTSYPLHLEMISDVYQDIFKSHMMKYSQEEDESSQEFDDVEKRLTNKAYLYKQFIDRKFEIELKMRNDKHPKVKLNVKKLRKLFLDIHKKVSVYYLFSKTAIMEILSSEEVDEVKDFLTDLQNQEEQNGIVQIVLGNQPKFVHLTFAEYLAAEFFYEKLISPTWSYLIWNFLTHSVFVPHKTGVCKFIESKLSAEDSKILDTFETNRQQTPFRQLLTQDEIGNTIEFLLDKGYQNVVLLLLKCISTVVDETNIDSIINMLCRKRHKWSCMMCQAMETNILCREGHEGSCIMCQAMQTNNYKVISCILTMITKIDEMKLRNIFYCEDLPDHHPLLSLVFSLTNKEFETFHTVMKELTKQRELLVDLFTLNQHGDFRCVNYLYTPAHMLFSIDYVMHHSKEYFNKLNKDQIKKIFSARDINGKNPALELFLNILKGNIILKTYGFIHKVTKDLVSLLGTVEDLVDLIHINGLILDSDCQTRLLRFIK